MIQSSVYSDFWLDKDSLNQYDISDTKTFSIDLIRLAGYRRIVSNFVFILTHLEIPVKFCCDGDSTLNFTDGKMIYLSSSIKKREDFDWSIGLALHEASHILLTDFDVLKSIFSRIPIPMPMSLGKKIKEKNLSENQISYLFKWVWNYIEDRYIDSYIFKEARGYRGYYRAMYDKFFYCEKYSKALKSQAYRLPNLLSYEFRILNLTHPDTDLDALAGLREIAELIDFDNIFRLKTTNDRIDLGYKVIEIIIDNISIQKAENDPNTANATIKTIHDKLSPKSEKGKKDGNQKGNEESEKKNDGDDTIKDKKNDEKSNSSEICLSDSVGNTEEFTKDELKEIDNAFDQQTDILNHDYRNIKKTISKKEESILSAIENAGIVLIPSGFGLVGDYGQASVDCIVVKKLTKSLIDEGPPTFPLSSINRFKNSLTIPPQKHEDAVARGFVLGKLLGKKLKIRSEENIIKYIRKQSGKIERRLLADIGAGMEDIFSKIRQEKYNKARLHISVDSSGSMDCDKKWIPTMTCVVAICVAASMVENLEVSVSFRNTISTSNGEFPYIVLAYDSCVDKISKVKQLFPYLQACGSTPEGLAFEAIAEEFIVGKRSNEQDHYFLNISDGEPCYSIYAESNKYGVNVSYMGEEAAKHTKLQVDKIRLKGVKILSYFIESTRRNNILSDPTWLKNERFYECNKIFKIMYGKDSQFIDVENVTDIAFTLNKLFLEKQHK